MTFISDPLVTLGEALGIKRSSLVAVERPDEIRQQFSVSLTDMKQVQPKMITTALDQYGSAFSLEFRTGELIEVTIDSSATPEMIASFLAAASTDYEVVLRFEKRALLESLGLLEESREVRLYLFTDALCGLMRRGLTEFESVLWRQPTRPLCVYLADSDANLVGPWLRITRLGDPSTQVSLEEKAPARAARVRDQRDRFIGWDEQWVESLTPAHLRLRGEASHVQLRPLTHGLFVTLAILYLADRARSRTRLDGVREIRAEFRGQAHVAVISVADGGTAQSLEEEELKAITSLVEWVYSIDESTDRDWVVDRLPFVQTRVAEMLEGRPEEGRLAAFTREARFLVEGVEWQWKAFIEGRISAYLENRKELEALVGDTVLTFRERGSELVKGLSDNILAAVGVLVGTFIAAAFADPFNDDLFRIGMIVYGVYLLVFPGVIGLSAHSIRFVSARSDFDERLKSYKRLLGTEVDTLVGSRVAKATRDYWIATGIVALFYLMVSVAALGAADRIPPIIEEGVSKDSTPAVECSGGGTSTPCVPPVGTETKDMGARTCMAYWADFATSNLGIRPGCNAYGDQLPFDPW